MEEAPDKSILHRIILPEALNEDPPDAESSRCPHVSCPLSTVPPPEMSTDKDSALTLPVNLEAPETSRVNLSPVRVTSDMNDDAPERETDSSYCFAGR